MALIEETSQEGILAKFEPMESLNWLEGSTATTVETGIVATCKDRAWTEDSY
jgi:hypothetical protein